jgi:hypothetical protein
VGERLTGQALLTHVKEQLEAGYTRDDAARTAGYIKGVKEHTDKVGFERAFNEAIGISVPEATQPSTRNRKPSGRVSVHKAGGATLSVAYMKQIGAVPGDEFTVTAEGNTITLELLSPDDTLMSVLDEEESEDADCEDVDLELVAA